MVVQASAITYFVGFFALLQIALGVALLWRRPWSPVRALAALLFVLNGLASVGQAARFLEPGEPPWALTVVLLFDDPTGIVLCLLAWAASRGDLEASWSRSSKLLTLTLLLSGFGFAILRAFAAPPEFARVLFVSGPVYAGYAALLVVLSTRLVTAADPTRRRTAALLLAGFGMRGAEFAILYTHATLVHWAAAASSPIQSFLTLTMLPAALWAVFIVARGATRHGRGDVMMQLALASLVTGILVGLVLALGEPAEFIEYVVSVLSLYIVRPLLVGEALLPGASSRLLSGVGLGFGGWLVVKLGLSLLFAMDPFLVSTLDIVALAFTLLIVPLLAQRWGRTDGATAADSGAVGMASGSPEVPPARRGSAAERILDQLVSHSAVDADGPGLTARELGARAGVSPKVIGREVARAEHLLRKTTGDPSPFIEIRSHGVRGRHHYRITDAGARAAASLSKDLDRRP